MIELNAIDVLILDSILRLVAISEWWDIAVLIGLSAVSCVLIGDPRLRML